MWVCTCLCVGHMCRYIPLYVYELQAHKEVIIEKEVAIEDLKEKYATLSETFTIIEEENEKLRERERCV